MTGSGEGLSLRFILVSAKPAPLEAFSAHDLLLCSTSTSIRLPSMTHFISNYMLASAKPAPLEAFSAHDLLLCSTSIHMKATTQATCETFNKRLHAGQREANALRGLLCP